VSLVWDVAFVNCLFKTTQLHWPEQSSDFCKYFFKIVVEGLIDVVNDVLYTDAANLRVVALFVKLLEQILNQHVVSNGLLLGSFSQEASFPDQVVYSVSRGISIGNVLADQCKLLHCGRITPQKHGIVNFI